MHRTQRRLDKGVGYIAIACWIFASTAAMAADEPGLLRSWLAEPRLTISSRTIETAALRDAYSTEEFKPLWVQAGSLNIQGQAVLNQLQHADTEGLSPARYGVEAIQAQLASSAADAAAATQRAMNIELLLSDGLMRYATDMMGGSVTHQWDTGAPRITAIDAEAALLQIAQSQNPNVELALLAPNDAAYIGLRAALGRYQWAETQGGWPSMPNGPKLMPGKIDARVPTLRAILKAQGDLTATPVDMASTTYDTALVEAAKRFQKRHDIESDGVIGKGTVEALNMSAADCIEQITLSMERMRWMPHSLGSRYVLVNIPAYRLHAVSGNRQLAMDVIVGKPDTPTPLFSKPIKSVAINPTWSVPAKIALKEMLPKIRKNPNYLEHANFSVVDSSGSEVSASAIDWETAGQGNFHYTFRQGAGDGNALGKVKFVIPDSDNIYLHDTSQHGLFARAERSLSHGCVRLSDPHAMTQFVLRDEGWSEQKIDAAYDSAASRTVSITPMPVYLVYWTAWADEHGTMHFSRDVYGKDQPLSLAMNAPRGGKELVKLALN